ncbi:MAG: Lrp/AsnC family transcriptional regulator [Gammaproteobacteria bacterium]|nr:Lrp/AsnC family transcriptional regulator [Rhodospirillaceae bacterium]MDE0365339.1 Lrp/AsnC family transcriptional regulator [Gammaproteobacteria bacterium]
MKEPLDETERKLFDLLSPNARVSNRKIAEQLDVTEGAIRHRLKKLTSARSMRVVTIVDLAKSGRTAALYIRLTVEPAATRKVIDRLVNVEEITYIAQVSGAADITFLLSGTDLSELFELFRRKIKPMPGVRNSTAIVISHVRKHDFQRAHFVE